MTSNFLSRSPSNPGRFRMQGIGLIEVMISVLVLGIGLLGIAAMQSLALRGGQSSLESSQAVMQTTAIIEAMRANPAGAAGYNRDALMCNVPDAGNLAQNDLRAWLQSLKLTIGSPNDTTTCGQVTGCPLACVITVRWNDARAGGGATREIVTETRL